jgi:hypothetical protein
MKRICKSSKQAVIIQSTENSWTKSNSLNEHMHLDNHPATSIRCETHLQCYHGQPCFSSISATSVAQGNETYPQIKQAENCTHTKHRAQPNKIKQPGRTHALGQPPFNDYRMRKSFAALPWAAWFGSIPATTVAQSNTAHPQIKLASCNHTKYREQPGKIKQPARTPALGQPPYKDYRCATRSKVR